MGFGLILERFAVSGLRNLDQFGIWPAPTINWITGLNGAGKTSFLEAILLLSRGRCSSSRKLGSLLGSGRDLLEISALLRSPVTDSSTISSLKFVQSRSGSSFSEDGRIVSSVHLLRRRLHVRMIAGNSQQLLEGSPPLRRLFLDWNLFHVEPDYGRILSDLKKATAQRNAWLRSGACGPAAWDHDYCRLAEAISRQRTKLVHWMAEFIRGIAPQFGLNQGVGLHYHEGWPAGKGSLHDLLAGSVREDALRGYTLYGPSRGDLSVSCCDRNSSSSRGEAKLLVFLLQLAAQNFWANHQGPSTVWLLDDLEAELDRRAIQTILAALDQLSAQVFVTAIADRNQRPLGHSDGPVFHVEQGKLVGRDGLG